MKYLENAFEWLLWEGRLFILLAVIFGMLGALILFVVASIDIYHVAHYTYDALSSAHHPPNFHEKIVGEIIGAVDLYLIAVVMLLFSFGLYELFISKIDPAESSESSGILKIKSLDQLKDKLAKVIVMVLIVSFFKRVINMEYHGALEMLYFALSILALGLALYFMHKGAEQH
ncbi:arginine/ornithine antiporter ArcD [Nitratiruptor sp. YY08-26]|uniref:YqhA family protein n=1 Tax=unclassified Nitratiruptor TaxID=2624044 RepID=UPI0019151E7D|nr:MULTISPECIES: YqhA family protein [unclassified Nitratiruptor]BCD61655.1 arginine/ornithine antiporter ArcD [Nitratiruptor sp. YY08-13]BCD65590.1 arginine/ornithine antiporter ArcD [Nitratiruptor sp. YY08-26]